MTGGGVDGNETIAEALRHEVREEACAEIEVGRLLLVTEYDPHQVAVQWIKLEDLPTIKLLPNVALQLLAAHQYGSTIDTYLSL